MKFKPNDWLMAHSNFFSRFFDIRIISVDEELGVYLVKTYQNIHDDGIFQVIDADVLEKHTQVKNI